MIYISYATGYFFPSSSNQTIQRQGYLKASLQKSSKPNSVILDLTIKGCENIPEGKNYPSCTEKQIVSNQQISCGTRKFLDQQRICFLYRPFECGVKETCSQLGQSNKGECVCLEGFARDSNGICSIPVPALISTASPRHANETTEPTKDCECLIKFPEVLIQFFTEYKFFCIIAAALAVNIVVPILIVTLVAALLYAAFKHGLIHRMMVNFSSRRFETMTVNDNDDDDSPLA